MIEQLIWKTRRYEYAYLAETRNLQVATEEHEAIADALERSDLSSACALLAKNMASTTEPLIAWLEAMDKAVETGKFKKIKSVIVIRDGELLVERYYNGAGPDITHNPRSVGKTFLIPVLGIAMAEGYIKSLDQPLSDFYDLKAYEDYSAKKARVTLRHLVTMTSGFDGCDFERDSPGNEENMYPKPDWVLWTLNLPMAADRNLCAQEVLFQDGHH